MEIGEGRRQNEEKGLASFDGDTVIPMVTGDKIIIKKASVSCRILKLNPFKLCRSAEAENAAITKAPDGGIL